MESIPHISSRGRRVAHCLCAVIALSLGACGSAPTFVSHPAANLIVAEPAMARQRFSQLLDFESASDLLFLNAPTGTMRLDISRGHTGQSSVALDPPARLVYVDLPSLLRGREFPGSWTLAGAFFYCQEPMVLSVYFFRGAPHLARAMERKH